MSGRSWRALFSLEWGELVTSRAFWLFLLAIGPLVGQTFLHAASLYAEASGASGGPAALAQGLSPLDGIFVPAFGAYDLAVTLLYPFVAIRLVSEEKRNGAARLLLQSPGSIAGRLAVKLGGLVLFFLLAWTAGLLALLLWAGAGGHVSAPELANLLLGHFLRYLLATAIALAAASVCEGAASAAIVTLSFTLGTWALDFLAAGRGGWLDRVAKYTPTAGLRLFEHGELRLAAAAVFLLASVGGIALAAVWLESYRPVAGRVARSAAVVVMTAAAMAAASTLRWSRDFSEDRRNSFSRADEAALRRIREPVEITVYLAPEDPRLFDLERGVLEKMRRVIPDFTVRYAARTRSGLFERGGEYGEVWYRVGSRRAMMRSTIEAVVLQNLYQLAGVAPPAREEERSYPGYPLAARLRAAPYLFFGAWPLAAGLAYLRTRGRWRKKWKSVAAQAV
jgi:ABC-type transport system involved in multi-copper enzyme maturation permease subunit